MSMKSNFKIPRIRNRRHLEFIRKLPCIRCFSQPSEACHIRTAANSGVGLKPGDNEVISGCNSCHRLAHQKGHSVFGDSERLLELANALWFLSGDYERAVARIVHFRKG